MSPVHLPHAQTFSFLFSLVASYVESRDWGIVLAEPFQVRFGGLRRRRSPDIFFVSAKRSSILKTHHCEGAPDLIIEITSPESESRDWREKYMEYQAAGVAEYWVIDPMSKHMEVYWLKRGRYEQVPEKSGKLASKALKGFYLKPVWLFGKKVSKVATILRELRVRA